MPAGVQVEMEAQFGSMLATAIALADGDVRARTAAWRQIVDIAAQAGSGWAPAERDRAFAQLTELQRDVPATDRRLASASLATLTSDRAIVALFAADEPGVAAPMLARATLTGADWEALIPQMPAASRNILRNRRDLPWPVEALLARFAPGDLALPGTASGPAFESGVSQIRELVEEIEAFRQRAPVQIAANAARIEAFQFETALDGTIDWIEGAPREALIGTTIATAAGFGEAGVDGGVAGAWRRRAPFEAARMVVAGSGPAGGDWLISGAPLFNPLDGRFCGYRGSARRPRFDERAAPLAAFAGPDGSADALRQLVHELRTPLNAILGFAEMIDRQLRGPVANRYRDRARSIVVETERLIAVVDDLDMAARLDTGRLEAGPAHGIDVGTLAEVLVAAHRPALEARTVTLKLDIESGLDDVPATPSLVERMFVRLLGAAGGVAAPGEQIDVAVHGRRGGIVYAVSRPAVLAGRDERALLDPGYGPDGDWPDAPLLGLGFTLRLVARLAAQCGGSFAILADRFEILLPVAANAAGGQAG